MLATVRMRGLMRLAKAGAAIVTAVVGAGTFAETPADSATQTLPGAGADSGKTVVYRDEWGVPHLYAPTVEAGLYAMGWAQAQDRPEQLLKNFLIALGEYASVAGPQAVPSDLRARMFGFHRDAKTSWPQTPKTIQRHVEAFTAGVNAWYEQHPGDRPEWWGDRRATPQMVDAFGRFFLYNWSVDEAYGDLRRGGVDPGVQSTRRASNQWAIAPERTAHGNAMLLADPHLSWWGVSRFWEVRIHAGKLEGSGVTLAGSPYIGLGHNANLAWAMTTGGPDTADVYTLELNPENPHQYRYDGEWRDLRSRKVTLDVRGEPAQTHILWFSHQGPIIARDSANDRAWAARTSYGADANRNRAWYQLNFAKDYTGAVRAGQTLGMFPQNMMVADTAGNIYYQRTGRVPRRPEGYDFSQPVDGSTSDTEWQGLHPSKDLVQVLNPPQGYMQNCNIPPDAMMKDSPLQLADYPDYIFSSAHYGPERAASPRTRWINQRGARALELLSADKDVTTAEARAWALDVQPYGVARWLRALANATQAMQLAPATAEAQTLLQQWDGRVRADSRAAQLYVRWRRAVKADLDTDAFDALRDKLDPWYEATALRGEPPATEALSQAQRQTLTEAFKRVVSHQPPQDTWGEVHRVGRDDQSWPVGGGGEDALGVTTLRTVGYAKPGPDGERRGDHGQTSTQVIELSDPIKSWIYLPVGQSDRPDSPHYDDQAEKLFSPRRLKPSRWRPEALAGHIESRTVLEGAP